MHKSASRPSVLPTQQAIVRFCHAWVRLSALSLAALIPALAAFWSLDAYSRPRALVLYALTGPMVLAWGVSYLAGRSPRWRFTAPEFPLWAFVFMLLLSTSMTVNARSTFFGAPGRDEGLIAILGYAALFLAGAHFLGSKQGFRSLAHVIAGTALLVTAYGILQAWTPPHFWAEAVIGRHYSSLGYFRVFSTLGSPVVYGTYLGLISPVLLAFSLSSRTAVAAFWVVGAGLGLASVVLTMTRAAWIGSAAGVLVFLLALRTRGLMQSWYRLALVLVVAVVLAIGTVGRLTTPEQLQQRALSSFDLKSGSTAQHLYLWRKTTQPIAERPMFGWGLETLSRVFPYKHEELAVLFGPTPANIDKAHNDLLQMAVSIGIPGALAYMAFWFLVLWSGVRLLRRVTGEDRLLASAFVAGLAAYLIQVQFSFSTVAVAPLVWLLAGSVVGWEAAEHGS